MIKMIGKLSVRLHRRLLKKSHGQSLVEMAIVAPIILFIFLGLIEVGWAVRGYLVLFSANRETTRYAARGDHLNFDKISENISDVNADVGYNKILTHTVQLLNSNGLGLQIRADQSPNTTLDPNGTFLLSHYYIDTGAPCRLDPNDPNDTCSDVGQCADPDGNGICDCSSPAEREPDYPYDDVILYPTKPGYDHFQYVQGDNTVQSRLDAFSMAQQLKEENDILNCNIARRANGNDFSKNSIIAVEAFYQQPQLLGVPIIANSFTDPIMLYNQSMMRVTTGTKYSQGSGCELLPMVLQENALNGVSIGDVVSNIQEGNGAGNFGWLRWRNGNSDAIEANGSTNTEAYLAESVRNIRLSIHDYVNPTDGTDTVLNAGNAVWGMPAGIVGNEVADAFTDLNGRLVSIPVAANVPSAGQNTIVNFAKFLIISSDFSGSPRNFTARYEGWDLSCPTSNMTTNDVPGGTPTPAPTATETVPAGSTATPTPTPTETTAASATPTPTNTATPTATATTTPTATPSPTPAAALIAWDNFENNAGRQGGWAASWSVGGNGGVDLYGTYQGVAPYQGSRQARMYDTTNIDRTVNLSSYSNVQFSFAWQARAIESSDVLRVRVYDGSWHTVLTIENGDDDGSWHVADIDLSGYNLTSNFKIRFQTDMYYDPYWDTLFIDDIEITGN